MLNNEKLYEIVKIPSWFYEITDVDLIIRVCDYLLEGNLHVAHERIPQSFTYEKSLKYNIENFNWDIISALAPNTCLLYLHGFLPIKHLIHGYNIVLKKDYIDLAAKLIESWLEYEPNSKNRFTWYDHSVSDRVIVMIYFVLTVKKNNITNYEDLINKINNSLIEHGKFLNDDDNYAVNNHGTMMNKSLYIISKYLNDDNSVDYRNKSIKRLKNELKRNFSDKMVYLENSITYHLFTLDLLYTIEKSILNPYGDSISLNQSDIEESIDFLIQCSKPNLDFPMLGDSIKNSLMKNYSFSSSENCYEPLEWLSTSGEYGIEPEKKFMVYPTEGYAFHRNSWNPADINEITYTSFKSGFPLKHHKHADDLSFTLFANGKDIFVDSGTYTYEDGDYRKFFISSLAHNTVVVDDETYSLERNNEFTGIIEHGEEKYYSYVVGKNDMYLGVNITRSLYFLKSGELIIVDDIQGDDIHEYSQYYHLDSQIEIKDFEIQINDNETLVKLHDNEIEVNIYQYGSCNVKMINGDKNKPGPGLVSDDFDNLHETTSLKFSKKSENARFITMISVNDEKNNNNKISLKNLENSQKEELIIHGNEMDIKIPLKDYSRDKPQYLHVEQNKSSSYTFTITDTGDDESFAWYIHKNGEVVDKIWYNSKPVLNYLFTEPGNYKIIYFIKKYEELRINTFHQLITVTAEDIKK
jgi:hypothetical protein